MLNFKNDTHNLFYLSFTLLCINSCTCILHQFQAISLGCSLICSLKSLYCNIKTYNYRLFTSVQCLRVNKLDKDHRLKRDEQNHSIYYEQDRSISDHSIWILVCGRELFHNNNLDCKNRKRCRHTFYLYREISSFQSACHVFYTQKQWRLVLFQILLWYMIWIVCIHPTMHRLLQMLHSDWLLSRCLFRDRPRFAKKQRKTIIWLLQKTRIFLYKQFWA
jgi:hypothetical protein